MSDLLRLLDLGSSAMLAHNTGIAVAARNTANVNTEGYTRESADFRSMEASPVVGGVLGLGPLRVQTSLLAGRERLRAGEFGLAQSFANAIDGLEKSMTTAQNDLAVSLAEMFGRFSELAASPMDEAVRNSVLAAADTTAHSFRSLSGEITTGITNTDARIEQLAGEASDLATEIAMANRSLTTTPDPVLEDHRELAAQKLAELIGGTARIDKDGKMRFVAGGGVVVVDGDRAASVQAVRDPTLGGSFRVEVVDGTHRADVTSKLDGGEIAGEIRFRDVTSAGALAELDQLAADLVTSMNGVHAANAGLDGVTGRNLFNNATTAATLDLDPTVAADSSLLAAAGPGTGPGDNQGALALLAMRDQAVAAAGTRTLSDEAIGLVVRVGSATATANAALEFTDARRDALAAVRDATAGVSIEEEMARISQFVHASEAAAKVIGTVDQLLGRLMEII